MCKKSALLIKSARWTIFSDRFHLFHSLVLSWYIMHEPRETELACGIFYSIPLENIFTIFSVKLQGIFLANFF